MRTIAKTQKIKLIEIELEPVKICPVCFEVNPICDNCGKKIEAYQEAICVHYGEGRRYHKHKKCVI